MADLIPAPSIPKPVEQTGPLDVGTSTSEFKMTVGGLVVVVATVAGGLLKIATDLQAQFPEWGWLATVVIVLGGIVGTAAMVMKYTGGRSAVKAAAVLSTTPPPTFLERAPALPTVLPPNP